jgi:phosphohistidine phosphatase SixA
MRIALVRHGRKAKEQPGVEEASRPMDPEERTRCAALVRHLEQNGVVARYIFASRFQHALDTAHHLRSAITRAVIPVDGLTPVPETSGQFHWEGILAAGWPYGFESRPDESIILVGHEDRLSNLIEKVSGHRPAKRLDHLMAVVLEVSVTTVAICGTGE